MKAFLGAVQFLTILPVGDHAVSPARMTPLFPLVGLLLGAMVGAFDLMAIHWWPPPVVGVLDVILLLLLSGALHMDGLGDTADGLYGQRPREKALAIMKDSRVGAMGAIAMSACILLKATALAALPAPRTAFLLVIPALARSTPLVAMRLLPYGRPEGGTGSAFFEKQIGPKDYWGLLLVLGTLAAFLRLRHAFWVSVGIPVALLGGLATMAAGGLSLSLISIFAFILALGLVVDDAIVVGESIERHQRGARDPVEAALAGTHRVAIPVVIASLTTMAASAPLLFLPGMIGWMSRPLSCLVDSSSVYVLPEP